MTEPPPGFGQTDLNEIFLRAFKDCTTSIINSLSNDANETATATAIQTIIAQLNYDYARLAYVVDVIQARVYADSAWVGAAVAVYDMMAIFIDPTFTHPELPIRGPFLIQHQLMRALQAQFAQMLSKEAWSIGFVQFLGQLCRAKDHIGALTPSIVLHILTGMVDSGSLFLDRNLDLLFDFVIAVGPILDTQALDVVDAFSVKLQALQEHMSGKGTVALLAVLGLMRLRESGWRQEHVGIM